MMNEHERDNLDRYMSPEQSAFFKDSKIRDEQGSLMTFYHGSSYEFDAFDIETIRSVDSDASYNGFWFSTDERTLPAWTKLQARYEVYLNVTNPAPMDVVTDVIRKLHKDWEYPRSEPVYRPESRSFCDEVRYRLQELGYDGIIHDWRPEVNRQELEEIGQTKITSRRGTEYLLKKDEEFGGLDLFYYDKDAPGFKGEHLTSYEDADDYLSQQECTVVCFRPEQIKMVANRTPTMDPNFKYNAPEKADDQTPSLAPMTYIDFCGDANLVFPRLNFYVDNDNLYLGLVSEDLEWGGLAPYCDVTVNIDRLPYLHSCIDTNNNGEKIIEFLEKNGFGEDTGMHMFSGFCLYPVFRFNEEKLREIDPEMFDAYAKAHGKDKLSLATQISGAASRAEQPNNSKEPQAPER